MSVLDKFGLDPGDVRKRLKRTNKVHIAESIAAGGKAGVLWTGRLARTDQLERLLKLSTDTEFFDEYCSLAVSKQATAEDIGRWLEEAILEQSGTAACRDFWRACEFGETQVDRALSNPWMLIGFARGAVDAFEEVEAGKKV